jgi:hypothetical protein
MGLPVAAALTNSQLQTKIVHAETKNAVQTKFTSWHAICSGLLHIRRRHVSPENCLQVILCMNRTFQRLAERTLQIQTATFSPISIIYCIFDSKTSRTRVGSMRKDLIIRLGARDPEHSLSPLRNTT